VKNEWFFSRLASFFDAYFKSQHHLALSFWCGTSNRIVFPLQQSFMWKLKNNRSQKWFHIRRIQFYICLIVENRITLSSIVTEKATWKTEIPTRKYQLMRISSEFGSIFCATVKCVAPSYDVVRAISPECWQKQLVCWWMLQHLLISLRLINHSNCQKLTSLWKFEWLNSLRSESTNWWNIL